MLTNWRCCTVWACCFWIPRWIRLFDLAYNVRRACKLDGCARALTARKLCHLFNSAKLLHDLYASSLHLFKRNELKFYSSIDKRKTNCLLVSTKIQALRTQSDRSAFFLFFFFISSWMPHCFWFCFCLYWIHI